jgi:hypothetical protein
LALEVQRGGIPGQPGAKRSLESVKVRSSLSSSWRKVADYGKKRGVSLEIHAFVTGL